MSQENVETVRRAVAALNARDLEGYLACCTEDVELHTPLEAVAGTYEGRVGIQRYLTDIEDAGPDFHIDLRDVEAIRRRSGPGFCSSELHGTREWYSDSHGGHDRL